MSLETIATDLAPKAIGPYSQAVIVGDVIYCSGMLGINPKTSEMPTSFNAQLQQIMDNIDGLLKSQNLSRANIVKTTVFLTDLKDFPSVNAEYEKFFSAPYPARSCVEVSALPKNAHIEIEIIVSKKN